MVNIPLKLNDDKATNTRYQPRFWARRCLMMFDPSIYAWSILKRYDDRFVDILTDVVCTEYVSLLFLQFFIAKFARIRVRE